MAYVTIEEVASYLAEHGYATWTELTTRQMLTESGMWTRLQSNYDSTHAIDSRYITFPTVDLSAYATEAAMKAWVQSQGYATTVPSLSGYATQQWVQQQGFLTQHQSLSGYATQSWVTARIQSSVSGFASQTWVSQTFLPLSGGTLTGALTFANNTWNSVGDDCYIGDHNIAGGLGILGRNGNTRLDFCQYEHAETYQSIVFDGTNLGVQRWKIGECVITYDSTNGMLHFSHGIYSDGAVTAGGVGTSGGGGGGGLTWDNLAAATNEQINVSHLTTALSGYLTSYGNRPQIGNLSDSVVTWLPASAYVVMPLVYHAGAGYYQLDLSSYAKTSGNNTFSGTNTFNKEIYISGTHSIVFNDDSDIAVNRDDELTLYGNNGVRILSYTTVEDTVKATGFVNSSDLRRKNLFGDVGLSVADIAVMPAVRFRWNSGRDTQTMHVGTIAQAWQTLLPEVVTQGSDGLLSMDYASAALVSVINVAKSVSDHERRILDLEAAIKRLKTELEQLKAA